MVGCLRMKIRHKILMVTMTIMTTTKISKNKKLMRNKMKMNIKNSLSQYHKITIIIHY